MPGGLLVVPAHGCGSAAVAWRSAGSPNRPFLRSAGYLCVVRGRSDCDLEKITASANMALQSTSLPHGLGRQSVCSATIRMRISSRLPPWHPWDSSSRRTAGQTAFRPARKWPGRFRQRSLVVPGIDQADAAAIEILDVAGGDRGVRGAGDGRDLTVGLGDGAARCPALGCNFGVGFGGRAVEG